MTILQAIVLGLVQGLGEFLPISSSGHLVLAPWLFGWPDPGLTFDVALHVGTLLAVVAYFWKDWLRLIAAGFTAARSQEGRLFWYLVLATIPGAIGGLLLEKWAETTFRAPLLTAGMLIAFGLVLYWTDRQGGKDVEVKDITMKTSIIIGIAQILALIPGVSRSGITMTAGLGLGLTREGATRFSFLLLAPIIFGAAVMKLPHLLANPAEITLNFMLAVLVSCLSGFASIGFLLRYVRTRSFLPFVWYRLTLGALVIIVSLIR